MLLNRLVAVPTRAAGILATAGSRSPAVRAAAVLLLAGALLILHASPAWAHGRSSDATNFSSTITATPDLPGVSWRVYGADEFLAVTNNSDTELVVLGYEAEPYLRVGPDGVFENVLSPAAYINDDRLGSEVPPGVTVDPSAEPQWQRISDGNRALWHDHRIHWMSPQPPVQVRGATDPVEVYERWEVPVRYGDDTYVVVGKLTWEPGPSMLPWLAVGLLLTAPAVVGLVRTRPEDGRWPGAARPAAVVLGVVAAANISHLVDDLLVVPLPWATIAVAALQTALFLGIGVLGALKAWQAGEGAFTALGVGAASILVGQGLLYLPALGASQTASLMPDLWSRLLISVSIAQALPVGLVAVLGSRATMPEVLDLGAVAEDLAGPDQAGGPA